MSDENLQDPTSSLDELRVMNEAECAKHALEELSDTLFGLECCESDLDYDYLIIQTAARKLRMLYAIAETVMTPELLQAVMRN